MAHILITSQAESQNPLDQQRERACTYETLTDCNLVCPCTSEPCRQSCCAELWQYEYMPDCKQPAPKKMYLSRRRKKLSHRHTQQHPEKSKKKGPGWVWRRTREAGIVARHHISGKGPRKEIEGPPLASICAAGQTRLGKPAWGFAGPGGF